MSTKPKSAHGDYEYLRSLNIEKETCEIEHHVLVATTIGLRDSPYRLCVRIEAWDSDCPQEQQGPLCSYEAHWPNEQAISWTAFLFRSMVGLARLVEDSRRDLWNDTLRAQKGPRRK